jgi:hypothetical protein
LFHPAIFPNSHWLIDYFQKFEIVVRNEQGQPLQAYLCPESADKKATEFAPLVS